MQRRGALPVGDEVGREQRLELAEVVPVEDVGDQAPDQRLVVLGSHCFFPRSVDHRRWLTAADLKAAAEEGSTLWGHKIPATAWSSTGQRLTSTRMGGNSPALKRER
jgi:hypothetical protein